MRDPPVTTLPKLKNWHDVAFLQWQKVAQQEQKDVRNLRYIISSDILNTDTVGLLERATGLSFPEHCEMISPTKKRVFQVNEEAYSALIASPNGRGAALILITHKHVFGEHAIIESVTAWCDEGGHINLMFTVGHDSDYDQDESGEDVDMESPS